MQLKGKSVGDLFERFAQTASVWAGTTWAFVLALAIILVWAVTGFRFHFSDTWQLVINTGTTITTFLMVFLLQRAQNKTALATHLKLNEIVAAMKGRAIALSTSRIYQRPRSELCTTAAKNSPSAASETLT